MEVKSKAKKDKASKSDKKKTISDDDTEVEIKAKKPRKSKPESSDDNDLQYYNADNFNSTDSLPSQSNSNVKASVKSVKPVEVTNVESMETVPVSKFNISIATVEALKERGIVDLFPIQAATFQTILEGKDLIGRARTGQGKTLAFCLPILEQLISKGLLGKGLLPKAIIMSPTRELAKQIVEEFSSICPNLRIEAIYGGTSLQDNYSVLRRGIDVIVGTPGRIKDLLDRKPLKLDETACAVLDEADQMLVMGFQEEIQAIFDAMEDRPKQVLLFSATMPSWVHGIADKYMNKDRKIIDLVGDSKLKAVTSVRHIAIPSQWTALGSMLNDIIAMFAGREGKVLVFCGTKVEVSHLL